MARKAGLRRPTILVGAVLGGAMLLAGIATAGQPIWQRFHPQAQPPEMAVDGGPDGGDPYYPADGNGGYYAVDYNISIHYDPASHHLDGSARITARATERLRSFDLDLAGLTVNSVAVNGRPAKFHRSDQHELVITPADPVGRGAGFAVDVRYGGVPKAVNDLNLGANGWQYSVSGGAFAAGEPHSASTWYPVNDTPTDKATFHLSATVPPGWSVISNGIERGSTPAPGGWTTYNWVEKTPIASYLTTVGIDKWTFERSVLPDGTPVVSAYAPGTQDKQELEHRLPEILAFEESIFGPYPQDAAGGIFLADNISFSLEAQTRPIFAQWTDLSTVVHENAHQWFGDSVSVKNWRDVCLAECFASYAQNLWAEAKEGVNLDSMYRHQVAQARDSSSFWAAKLYDMGPGNEFTAVYTKGAMAMHALRRQIGEQAFATVLRGWPALHRNGNASWPQFEDYVQQVSRQGLHEFFQEWFHGTKIPEDKYLWPGSLHR